MKNTSITLIILILNFYIDIFAQLVQESISQEQLNLEDNNDYLNSLKQIAKILDLNLESKVVDKYYALVKKSNCKEKEKKLIITIKNNSIFNPLRNCLQILNLSSNNKINNQLITLVEKAAKEHFAYEFKDLSLEELDQRLEQILRYILNNKYDYCLEHDKILARLIISGAAPNILINFNFYDKETNNEILVCKRNLLMIIAESRLFTNLMPLLIEYGINVNCKDNINRNALMLAIINNNSDIAEFLILNTNIDINASDGLGRTALMYAACNGNIKILKLLIKKWAKINNVDYKNKSALMSVISKNNRRCVNALLESGADIHEKNIFGESSIIIACRKNNLAIVHILLKYEPNLDDQDNEGNSALMYAVKLGNKDIVDLLVKRGANLKLINLEGDSALTIAIKEEHEEIVELLVKLEKSQLSFCLILASYLNNLNIAKKLLQEGASKHYRDISGNRALNYALENKNRELVKLLLN